MFRERARNERFVRPAQPRGAADAVPARAGRPVQARQLSTPRYQGVLLAAVRPGADDQFEMLTRPEGQPPHIVVRVPVFGVHLSGDALTRDAALARAGSNLWRARSRLLKHPTASTFLALSEP